MTTCTRLLGVFFCLAALSACNSSSTEPVPALPEDVIPYHYTTVLGVRYYAVQSVPPDSCWFDTTSQTNICKTDTLIDSVWRVYTDPGGVFWSQSYRAYRYYDDSLKRLVDSGATSRREGRRNPDTLFYDPSLLYRILVRPIAPGRNWAVDDSGTIVAGVSGEETLALEIGSTRTWHISSPTVGDEWYAPGLGRVAYEQFQAGGRRIRAELFRVEQP